MGENEKLNLFLRCLAVFLFAGVLIDVRLRARRRSKKSGAAEEAAVNENPIYGAEISRRRLIRIAIGVPLRCYLFALLLVLALMLLARSYGRMRWGTFAGALITVAAFLGVFSVPAIVQLIRPLRWLKKMRTFDEEFSGKRFVWCAGAWQYVDSEWFIRVGGGESAVLYAPEINFEIEPVSCNLSYALTGKSGGARYVCRRLCFRCVDGGDYMAAMQETASLKRWMQSHRAKYMKAATKKTTAPTRKRKARE